MVSYHSAVAIGSILTSLTTIAPPKSLVARQFTEAVDEANKPCYCCSWRVEFSMFGNSAKRKLSHLISCVPFHEHVSRVLQGHGDEEGRLELIHALLESLIQLCRPQLTA
jgi:hypothetical protein